MGIRWHRLLMGLFALLAFAAAPGGAQSEGPQSYAQQELEQLLAPVALYPDQLLMQVLIASTYPLEVVEAARFVQQNPNLQGDALDNALAARNWDPSVQSLAAFPQVLEMMNEHLDWMQRLGDAFLVDQQRVMDTVQALRARAVAAGNLQSTTQQTVATQDGVVIIEPAQPEYVYVPYYNPMVVYGPWWAPDYPPWFWTPPAIYGYPVWGGIAAGIYFGSSWHVSHTHWGWVHPDWRGRHVNVYPAGNRFWDRPGRPAPPPGGNWQHEPGHRRGIAYPDLATHDRYRQSNPDAVRSRQEFRAHDVARPTPGAVPPSQGTRPAPSAGYPAYQGARPPQRQLAPGFDPGVSRRQVETNAQRGQQSRQSAHPPAAPASRPSSSAPAAPSPRPSSGSPSPRGGVQKK